MGVGVSSVERNRGTGEERHLEYVTANQAWRSLMSLVLVDVGGKMALDCITTEEESG